MFVRVIDFGNDQWKVIEEKIIWGASVTQKTQAGQKFHEMVKVLRFGQPSLLQLSHGEILATHWAVVNGQGKILTHRLRISD